MRRLNVVAFKLYNSRYNPSLQGNNAALGAARLAVWAFVPEHRRSHQVRLYVSDKFLYRTAKEAGAVANETELQCAIDFAMWLLLSSAKYRDNSKLRMTTFGRDLCPGSRYWVEILPDLGRE